MIRKTYLEKENMRSSKGIEMFRAPKLENSAQIVGEIAGTVRKR